MPNKYIDVAELEYKCRDLPYCQYCFVEAGKICVTVNGNLTNPHALRTAKPKPKPFENDSPEHDLNTLCTAQMHNVSKSNIWHHDCWLPKNHDGYHECHHHNRTMERGCLWQTGQFIRDEIDANNI